MFRYSMIVVLCLKAVFSFRAKGAALRKKKLVARNLIGWKNYVAQFRISTKLLLFYFFCARFQQSRAQKITQNFGHTVGCIC